MNSIERMKALVENKPVDRPAIAGWIHMPLVDGNTKDFVKSTIDFTENNCWDFVKVMFNGYYSTQDFGQTVVYSTKEDVAAGTIVKHMIEHPNDFINLKVCDMSKGIYARELESTKWIIDYFKGKTPVIATIFSPLATAQEMYCGHKRQTMMIAALNYSPKQVQKGLEIITETTIRFLEELVKLGIDGVFYATHYCSRDVITKDLHDEFARKYDLLTLNTIKGKTWFNMLHLHGSGNIMLEEHKDYPVQAFNWEDKSGDPKSRLSIAEGKAITDKLFIGGINQFTDFYEPNNDREKIKKIIKSRLEDAISQIGSERLVLAPGCALMNDVPMYRYSLVKEVIDDYVKNH